MDRANNRLSQAQTMVRGRWLSRESLVRCQKATTSHSRRELERKLHGYLVLWSAMFSPGNSSSRVLCSER